MMRLVNLAKALRLLSRRELVGSLAETLRLAAALESVRQENPGARIDSGVRITGAKDGRFSIAAGSAIETGTLVVLGDTLNGFGTITIGPRTWIGEYNNIRVSKEREISIGADCLISQFVTIIASNHDTRRDVIMSSVAAVDGARAVSIGDDCWLGAGVTVLAGAAIGRGVVVGANSVVRGKLDEYGIYAGSPAVKIGERR